jgi:hypothetical protein
VNRRHRMSKPGFITPARMSESGRGARLLLGWRPSS